MSEPIVRDAEFQPREDLDALQRKALIAGAVGLAATAAGFFLGESVYFYRAYLVAWLWTLGIALGLFAISMLAHISGGDWGVVMRRLLQAGGRTLPFFVVAGIPLVFGLEELYAWAKYESIKEAAYLAGDSYKHDHLLDHKAPYLNVTGFLGRALIYFIGWTILAYVISAWSDRYDATGDPALKEKMKKLSCFGLIFYVVSATLAVVDWVMSLDPHWFSSLFGFSYVAGHALSAFAFVVPLMLFLSRRKPMSEIVGPKLFHDYGKFMLAAVMVWGYFMISQYLIIWSGNLPEGVGWYIVRSSHGWQALSILLIVGHFVLPFSLLLSADLKKQAPKLMIVACWLLGMRWLDFYWQAAPSLDHYWHSALGSTLGLTHTAGFHWLNLAAPIGIGGVWLALLLGQLKGRAIVPVRDPALEEVMAHG